MTWLSGGDLHAGAWTSSNYPGFGILFENLPTTGESGGSPLLNDGGVNGDEVRWELLTQTGLTVDAFYEDGSFESTGTGSFTYRSFVNNSSVGDFTVTVNAATTAYSITCDPVSDTHNALDVQLVYTTPSGTAYSIVCDSIADSHQVGAVIFNRGYTMQANAVTDNHSAIPATLSYSGEQIVLIGSFSVNYKQDIISASYKPTLIEVTYGGG